MANTKKDPGAGEVRDGAVLPDRIRFAQTKLLDPPDNPYTELLDPNRCKELVPLYPEYIKAVFDLIGRVEDRNDRELRIVEDAQKADIAARRFSQRSATAIYLTGILGSLIVIAILRDGAAIKYLAGVIAALAGLFAIQLFTAWWQKKSPSSRASTSPTASNKDAE